jgi:hypothetical protein
MGCSQAGEGRLCQRNQLVTRICEFEIPASDADEEVATTTRIDRQPAPGVERSLADILDRLEGALAALVLMAQEDRMTGTSSPEWSTPALGECDLGQVCDRGEVLNAVACLGSLGQLSSAEHPLKARSIRDSF